MERSIAGEDVLDNAPETSPRRSSRLAGHPWAWSDTGSQPVIHGVERPPPSAFTAGINQFRHGPLLNSLQRPLHFHFQEGHANGLLQYAERLSIGINMHVAGMHNNG